jgi:choline dehydrogenase-like flavoprotein
MLNDFDRKECPVPGNADVCVVGAGAAGILLATELAAAGRRVTLLEGGGRRQEDISQEIYRSELVGLPHHGVHDGRFRTYGGTTTQWGGEILELDSFDFEPRAHVAGSGWPFPKSTLIPYYERALIFAGLRRVERDDEAVRASLALKAVDPGHEFRMLYSRFCPETNFAVLHARELTSSRRLSIYTHANVVELVLKDQGDAIEGVRVRGFSGREALVTAHQFVFCLGGIETTRLLLQPRTQGTAPWQANGMLGRYFQDHISLNGIPIRVMGPQPVHDYFGYRTAKGFRYHSKIQLTQSEQLARKTLNVVGTINPFRHFDADRERARNTLRAAIRGGKRPAVPEGLNTARHLPGIAAQFLQRRVRGEEPAWKRTMLSLHSEQLPLSASAISLSDERDGLGLRRTRLNWQISDEEVETLRTYVRVATGAFQRKGFAIVDPPRGFYEDADLVRSMCCDSFHHIGGTRMSVSPADGVVNPNLQLHGVANAFVCSLSVFPCSGFSNPTHTLLALAMRLSDQLIGAHEDREPSERGKANSAARVRMCLSARSRARPDEVPSSSGCLLRRWHPTL